MPGGLPDSASSNASAFGLVQGLASGPPELDVGLGASHAQPQLPSPVAKKGRTNTPWTPAEEQRLKTLRDAGSSWSEIAKTFPTRTEGSVKKHWYKVRRPTPPASPRRGSPLLIRTLAGHALRRVRGRRSEQFRSPPARLECGDVEG